MYRIPVTKTLVLQDVQQYEEQPITSEEPSGEIVPKLVRFNRDIYRLGTEKVPVIKALNIKAAQIISQVLCHPK